MALDSAASNLYRQIGLDLDLEETDPFMQDERSRWANAICNQQAFVATDSQHQIIGFVTTGSVDGEGYIDQLSVHPDHMRQGVGSALMKFAEQACSYTESWLTTYSHVPWNKPYYQKLGYREVELHCCGPEILQILEEQKAVLPCPQYRIAMLKER